jgi:PAS domain S-box-containing protein
LYSRAVGYTFDAVKIFCTKNGQVTKVPYREHVPPDVTACIFWLKNRKPAELRVPLGPAAAFGSWYLGQLRTDKIVRVRSIDDLPAEAIEEIEYFRQSGIHSSVGIPLRVGDRIVGFISFSAFRSTREWPDDLIARLKIVGELLAQAVERKRSEAALQASEERWRSMFEASNIGISVIDQNLRYIAANSAFRAMLGYTDNELQQLTPMDITVEEDRDLTQMRLAELQQGKGHHYEFVKRYRRKDGAVRWGHSYVSVVKDGQSTPKMFIGTVIDMTETKRAQDTLRATQSKLADIRRLTTVHAVTASIAHEVNQPLAAIVANGSAAMRFLAFATPDLDAARTAVKSMVADGHRAAEVIESIRAMFKKTDQELAPLDINKLILDVLVLMELRARERKTSQPCGRDVVSNQRRTPIRYDDPDPDRDDDGGDGDGGDGGDDATAYAQWVLQSASLPGSASPASEAFELVVGPVPTQEQWRPRRQSLPRPKAY